LIVSPLESDSAPSDCCLKIPSKCHFLCGVGSVGFWSLTKWKCKMNYYPTVVKCKFISGIDYVKVFGRSLTQNIKNGFDKLSTEIKKKLVDAKEFAKATVNELMQVPQDVLCSLKDSISGMTSKQFRGLVNRFTKFTAQNLKKLLSSINPQAFFDSIDELMGKEWDAEQLSALLKAAFKKFGEDIRTWGKEAFASLKQLIAGIDSGELMQMTSEGFEETTNFLCTAKLNDDQKQALLVPAKAVYGDVSNWDDVVLTKLCGVLRALPVEEVLQLTQKVVATVIDRIASAAEFSYPQGRALLEKVKKEIGTDISKWSAENVKKVGKLLKDLDVQDLKKLLSQQFKDLADKLGDVDWSPGRARELAKKAIEALGEPGKWSAEDLKKLKSVAGGMLPSELKQLVNKVLKDALKTFKKVELEIDQVTFIYRLLQIINQLQNVDGDDLISLAKALDGFLASDIGQMTQVAVFIAFPELKVAKEIAMPIRRELIKMAEKDASGKSKLDSLHAVAVGLSRSELDDESMESVVNNLDQLGAIPWDKTQVIELAKKVRDKWGNINETDSSESDTPNWGFINLKKLGRVALGIAKEELRDLPIRGIEDAIDVLGQQKEWDRGQVANVLKRLREYWEMEELSFSNFTELDINSLGSFVQGLTDQELKNLPQRVLLIAVRRLGEETGIPQDKLKARAFMAVEFFKNQSGIDILNSTHIRDMGNLVAGMSRGALSKISQDAFVKNLYTIARSKGFDELKVRELAKLAKKHFVQSDVGKWTGKQWRDLGPAIVGLTPSDLRRISKEALEEVMDEMNKLEFSKAQAQALVSAAKEAYGKSDFREWTGDQLRQLGSLARGLDIDDILSTSKDAFEDAVGVWGKQLNIDRDNLKAMAAMAKRHLVGSDVSKITAMHLKRLGRVVLGFESSDLERLNIDSADVIAALGKWKGWTNEQLEALKPKIKKFLADNSGNIDYLYMSLGELGKALSKVDISQIPSKSFNLAVKQLGELEGWDDEQLKGLMDKAKMSWTKGAEEWDKARVSELGYIQKSLSTGDIPKLDPKVVDAIKPEVLGSMSLKQLKSFTAEQYRAMETSQVQAISRSKFSMLTADQKAAIEGVKSDDPIEEDPWGPDCAGTCSGASHVTVSLLSMLGIFVAAVYISH
ncbi:stereocilin-like, partial [Actinia tenebrosa]|uniref:Stereocilin-like n=1 Tax=Actinia tenebrosa TaxID=6105 RepID=A0A6P8HFT7_ACTTE